MDAQNEPPAETGARLNLAAPASPSGRIKASAARWIDVCLYGVLAAVTLWLIEQASARPLRLSVEWSPGRAAILFALFVVAVTSWSITFRILRSWRHLWMLLRVPPLAVSVLLGLAFLIFEDPGRLTPDPAGLLLMPLEIACLLTTVGFGVLLGLHYPDAAWRRWRFPPKQDGMSLATSTPSEPGDPLDAERLARWFNVGDDPVADPHLDLFSRTPAAAVLADHLRMGHSCAILGSHGSGKTSLRRLAQTALKDDPLWFVEVAGWELSADDAPRRVLEAAVRILGRHIDVTGLWLLPRRYEAAVGLAPAGVGALLQSLRREDPLEVLSRIESQLEAAGRRLAICLEDLDRGPGTDPAGLKQAAAMMDRLRGNGRIIFVVAIGASDVHAVDVLRLCDHVEPMLPLTDKDYTRLVGSLLTHRLNLPAGAVDFAKQPEDRMTFVMRNRSFIGMLRKRQDPGERHEPTDWFRAFCGLLDEPRKLKAACRMAAEAWADGLAGEIEAVELLVSCALRVGAFDAWLFFAANATDILAIEQQRAGGAEKASVIDARRQKLHAAFEVSTAMHPTRSHAGMLIASLVPGWAEQAGRSTPPARMLQTVQSTTNSDLRSAGDYARRLVRLAPLDQPRDQHLVKLIRDFHHNLPAALSKPDERRKPHALAALLLESARATRLFESWNEELPPESTAPLFQQFLESTVRRYGSASGWERDNDAFPVLYRIFQRGAPLPMRTFSSWIYWAVPRSLTLAVDVEYYLANQVGDKSEATLDETRRLVQKAVKRTLADPADWINTLSSVPDEGYWTLTWLVQGHHLKRTHLPVSVESWRFLAQRLLAAAAQSPDLIVPHLSILVARGNQNGQRFVEPWTIDTPFLLRWAGAADAEEIVRVLSLKTPMKTDDEKVNLIIEQIHKDAIWIQAHGMPQTISR